MSYSVFNENDLDYNKEYNPESNKFKSYIQNSSVYFRIIANNPQSMKITKLKIYSNSSPYKFN